MDLNLVIFAIVSFIVIMFFKQTMESFEPINDIQSIDNESKNYNCLIPRGHLPGSYIYATDLKIINFK